MKNTIRKSNGYTLVEMLIAISIFMIFLAIVAGSYMSLVSANRKANEAQRAYREVRFVFDSFAGEIRSGMLDYSCIDQEHLDAICLDNQNTEDKKVLAVLHNYGKERVLFKFKADDKNILMMKQERISTSAAWSGGEWQTLNTEKLTVDNLAFSFFPSKDPYSPSNATLDAVQWQPAVTIKMKANGFDFRTTYSSRVYGNFSIYETK